MTPLFVSILLAASLAFPAQNPPKKTAPNEEDELRQSMGEAGSSPLEVIRALERHLAKFPESKNRQEIERALVRASIDARDNTRILKYGEPYLKQDPNDLLVLERISRILTTREDKASNERGLAYSITFEKGMRDLEKQKPENGRITAQLRDDLDRGVGRALTFQARAKGHLGEFDEAVTLAKRGFEVYPSAEPAREIAAWLIKQNKIPDALPHLADAFSLPDVRVSDEDRRSIRIQMGEMYRKVNNNEKGLGDVILAAYDRAVVIQEQRRARLRAVDPNANVTNPMEYTISGVNGETLDLKSLRGKVVVLDFWATWCGPCRVQYPMYEKVKEVFKSRSDVVFLGINTDQEHDAVKPFLEQNKWNKAVYFEDGLSALLKVSSIPATVIFNRKGEMSTRLNGFVPDRFVDMLSDRIKEALAQE